MLYKAFFKDYGWTWWLTTPLLFAPLFLMETPRVRTGSPWIPWHPSAPSTQWVNAWHRGVLVTGVTAVTVLVWGKQRGGKVWFATNIAPEIATGGNRRTKDPVTVRNLPSEDHIFGTNREIHRVFLVRSLNHKPCMSSPKKMKKYHAGL